MTNQVQMAELEQLLLKMPQRALVDALLTYAAGDDIFTRHFTAIGRIMEGSSQASILAGVTESIERIFGDRSIPGSLNWEQRVKFTRVADLIEELFQFGMHDAAIHSAESCFELVGNLAGVHRPDDFLDFCFEPIIRLWILALHSKGVSAISIAHQVSYLEASDRYGAFWTLEGRFAKELGREVLDELALKQSRKA